jgi:hypothetical protein
MYYPAEHTAAFAIPLKQLFQNSIYVSHLADQTRNIRPGNGSGQELPRGGDCGRLLPAFRNLDR